MPCRDVYLLMVHEPYTSREHPVPVNATIVHAASLLHPTVPQPDGGRIYRCLTEFPGRVEGGVVPLSTLTFELDGGRLWSQVADWEVVEAAVVRLTRQHACDAMPLGLPDEAAGLLAQGPTSTLTLHFPDGRRATRGPADREQQVTVLAGHVATFAAQGPFWPGDGLVAPPSTPNRLPYRPYQSRGQ